MFVHEQLFAQRGLDIRDPLTTTSEVLTGQG